MPREYCLELIIPPSERDLLRRVDFGIVDRRIQWNPALAYPLIWVGDRLVIKLERDHGDPFKLITQVLPNDIDLLCQFLSKKGLESSGSYNSRASLPTSKVTVWWLILDEQRDSFDNLWGEKRRIVI